MRVKREFRVKVLKTVVNSKNRKSAGVKSKRFMSHVEGQVTVKAAVKGLVGMGLEERVQVQVPLWVQVRWRDGGESGRSRRGVGSRRRDED